MQIDIFFKFDPRLAAVFQKVRAETVNSASPGLKPGMEAAGREYLDYAERRFRSFSGGGGTWPRLAPSTIKRKGHARILIDKGRLLRSLKPKAPDNRIIVNARGLTTGTSVPYSKYHQTGTSRMPKRAVWELPNPRARKAMSQAINAALLDTFKRAAAALR